MIDHHQIATDIASGRYGTPTEKPPRGFFLVLGTAAALLLALWSFDAFAQQGSGPDNGGITRGNFLRIPDYRTPGTALQSYFVNASTGSDSFSCQSASTPCLTIQGALNKVPKLLRDQVTVNVAAGSYGGFIISGFVFDTGIQQTTGGLLIDGALVNSTLATGSATGTAAGGGQSAGSGATFGTLCDSGATWTVNDLRGRFVTTASPTNTTLVVSSNTATCLTVVGTWSLPVAGATTYMIQDPSVIVNTAATLPATPLAAATASQAAVEALNNLAEYRDDVIVLRNLRLANTVGAGVFVSGTGGLLITVTQVRPSAVGATGIQTLSASNFQSSRIRLTNVDVSLGTSNSGVSIQSGVFQATNTLFRNSSISGQAVLIGSANVGALARMAQLSASETLGFRNAVISSQGFGNGVFNSRFACGDSAGTGFLVGSSTTNISGLSANISTITLVDVSTCGVGVQVVGQTSADVTSMSGSVATTGFAAFLGGLISFSKAGVTLTAGTNEINLDSGGLTAAFSDVTAGDCVSRASSNSRVCGR